MKIASTVDQQITLLRQRGMLIEDEEKAKEILLDVGYYRLGFYWFPFEVTYPELRRRTHQFVEGASFREATDLYYLDTEIRNLLAPYLYRIEVNLRTFLIYIVSNHYHDNPTWFVDPRAVRGDYVKQFDTVYEHVKRNETIARHHRNYPNDRYAPAWKTLEYMTFGDILILSQNLKEESLRKQLAAHYGLRNMDVFWNWMNTIRVVRNLCAHGHNLYDLRLQKSIKKGPLGDSVKNEMLHTLHGVLCVVFYLLQQVSVNRKEELRALLRQLLQKPEVNAVGGALRYLKDLL